MMVIFVLLLLWMLISVILYPIYLSGVVEKHIKANTSQILFITLIAGPFAWLVGFIYIIYQHLGKVNIQIEKQENKNDNDESWYK